MFFRDHEVAALEALLFVAKEPLSVAKLAELVEIPVRDMIELIEALQQKYQEQFSPFVLIETEEHYRLGTKPEMAKYIEALYKQPTQVLSHAALEVLSIIAYKQPITRGEIDFIRGVQSDRALATLAERGLVKEVGRKEGPGRPILFGTTGEFLLHFGLQSLAELPELDLDSFRHDETGENEE